MKLAVFALVVATAAAFQPPTMTFAVGKKKAPTPKDAKAAATKAVSKAKVEVKSAATKAKSEAKSIFSKAKQATQTPSVTKAVKAVKKADKTAKQSFLPFLSNAKRAEQKVEAKVKPAISKVKSADKQAKSAVKSAVKPIIAKAKRAVTTNAPKPPTAVKKAIRAAQKPARALRGAAIGTVPSTAIPYEQAPGLLDGSFVGDVGFDPCFLSTKADTIANYFNGLFTDNANIDGLTWYREAELMHGRIAMIAVLGFIVPGFGTFNGNEWTGYDAFNYPNPLEALGNVPSASLFQIFAFMAALEFRRINIIINQGDSYMAGDSQRWGQGEGRWNPFKFNYTPAQYEEKQLQEIKHARLAMVALLGLYFQANISGVNVVQQWSKALVIPDYVAKAGYFLPEGI